MLLAARAGAGRALLIRRPKNLILLLIFVLSLGAAGALRLHLVRERQALKLTHEAVREGPGAPRLLEALTGPQIVLASATLGILRPLAINFLWLRYLELQERGEFLELPALADAITALEPRLPQVWEYQAWNLGYNVSAAYPRSDRFGWVVRAISLLRDDGLRFNPESPRLYAELAYLFYHKIGLDFDEAGSDYRSQLAAVFDLPPGSQAEAALLKEWRLDPDTSRRLASRFGVARIDFRAAGAHALYWSERGLEAAGPGADASDRQRLQDLAYYSLRSLLERGYPLRAGSRRAYAFVPDLDYFEAAARETRRWVAEHARDGEERRKEMERAFLRDAVCFHFLFGRLEAARALLAGSRELIAADGKSIESLAMESFLQADPDQAGPGQVGPVALSGALESSLEASLLLALLPDDPAGAALSRGFLSLARLFHAALKERAARESTPAGKRIGEFEDYLAAARERRVEGKGGSPPSRELPWHLEILDPRRGPED